MSKDSRLFLGALLAILIVGVALHLSVIPHADPDVLPMPTPESRIARVLVITQPGCPHCDRLKREWPADIRQAEWIQNTPELSSKYRFRGVPCTLALDGSGNEIKRLVGWYPPEQVKRFLTEEDWIPAGSSSGVGALTEWGDE